MQGSKHAAGIPVRRKSADAGPTNTVASRPQEPDGKEPNRSPVETSTPDPASGWKYRRRRLNWVFGLAALGTALLAQKVAMDAWATPADSPPLLSWVLYGVAIALFMLALPPAPYLVPHATTPFKSTLRAMRQRRLFVGLLAGAALCGLASVPLFVILNMVDFSISAEDVGPPVNYGSWLLYVAALLMLGGAWVVWERNARARGRRAIGAKPWNVMGGGLSPRAEWAVMGVLLVLALLFRLPNLNDAPPGLWFDEAMNGVVAREILQPGAAKVTFIGQFTQMGSLYFYFLGWVTQLFGPGDIWPLRLLPALAGSLIAPLLYIIGSRLFGWRVGLAAGVFVAVSVWNVTMSRFGVASIPTIALDIGVYACLVQGLRTGRLGYYAGGGVLLGLALQMYYPSQLVPVVLALVFAHLLVTGRMKAFRAVRAGAVVFIAVAVLAALPVLTFAAQQPGVYTERAGNVSIFGPGGSDNKPDALGISAKAHALMFTFKGDRNPRHNVPDGSPMLEWPVSALFVVGLGACLLRSRRWQYFFPVVWLLVAASGGVFSALFEAPQGHRTMENSVVSALLAGILVGELWALLAARSTRAAKSSAGANSTRWAGGQVARVGMVAGAALALGLFVWAGYAGYNRYFNRQVTNVSVWSEMQGPNLEVAKTLLRYGPTHRVMVNPSRNNSPAAQYLAPDYPALPWTGPGALPFTDNDDTVIVLDATEEAEVSVIKSFYPDAVVETAGFGDSRAALMYRVFISKEEMAAVRGVRYTVSAGGSPREGKRATMSLEGIDTGQRSTFEISATLKVDVADNYKFGWEQPLGSVPAGAEPVTVLVDGAPITGGEAIQLGSGLHSLVVRGPAERAAKAGPLVWESEQYKRGPIPETALYDPRKIAPVGLTANVRPGEGFDGPPALKRVDPIVSFYFHTVPLARPYTTEWVGKLYAPVAGSYTLYTEQISTSRLIVDGQDVLYNDQENSLQSGTVQLTKGLHDIRVQYQDLTDFSHMYLYWTPPGRDGRYTIPAKFLLPEMAEYPSVPSTGSWPAAEEADDTVWALNPASEQQGTQAQSTPNAGPTGRPTATSATAQEFGATAGPTAEAKSLVPLLLLGGPEDKSLERPLAATADEDGNLYIFTESGAVRRFGPGGEPQGSWDAKDAEGKPLIEVSAMLAENRNISLLDSASSNLITYSRDGKEQKRVLLCQCFYPRGVSKARDGNLWLADTGLGRVIKVTPEGTLVTTLGEKGAEPGQFVEPAGVWEAPDGTVYVADVGNARVQSFDADGKPLAQWPMGTSLARDGSRVAATGDGNVLVTEQQVQAIVLYDRLGKELARWTYNPGSGPHAPSIIVPAGQEDRYLVLFPFNATAAVFNAAP